MTKIALGIEYDGTLFHGWQKQPNLRTVQAEFENALSKVADDPIQIYCAGRTDARVHALNQVIHFECGKPRSLDAWVRGTNTFLPDDISVKWAKFVNDDFHARFSAIARQYHYLICNQSNKPAILRNYVTWERRPLDINNMHKSAQYFLGEQDFSSLRAAECQSNTPMRNVMHAKVYQRADGMIMFDVKANAFLHHMVRNMIGILLEIGKGVQPVNWVEQVLQAKDRRAAAKTAPPQGLYLVDVKYSS